MTRHSRSCSKKWRLYMAGWPGRLGVLVDWLTVLILHLPQVGGERQGVPQNMVLGSNGDIEWTYEITAAGIRWRLLLAGQEVKMQPSIYGKGR